MTSINVLKSNTALEKVLSIQAALDANYWKAKDGITQELLAERGMLMTALAVAERELNA